MPIYEYECEACHHHEEHTQRVSDPPVEVCAHCGQRALHRVISSTSFHLKGGGWYKDGYGSAKSGGGSKE